MKRLQRTLLVTIAILWATVTLSGQTESHLTYRRYTPQDGLPQMQTERLYQDSRGYIYIGTLSGFVRFDGRAFTPFLKGQRYNIVGFGETDGQVSAFDFRRQWLTDYDGVRPRPIDPSGRWLLNNFNSGSLPDGYFILENEQEEQRRLCRLTKDGFMTVKRGALFDQMTPNRKLYMDSTLLYVPTEQGLYRVEHNTAQLLTAKGDICTLLRTRQGLLAFARDGIYEVGGLKAEGGGLKAEGGGLKAEADWSAASYGLTVRAMANGHLVIADEHTLYDYDGHGVKAIATGFNLIKDVLIDRWDRLWVATYEGLYCFFNRAFTCHRLTDKDDIVRAIGIDSTGSVVMGTLNGKVLRDGKVVADDANNYFAPNAVSIGNDVFMAANGDVMSVNGNVTRLGLPHDRYQFVSKAGGRLIVGSRKSIIAYTLESGHIDTLQTGTPYPWCAADDGQGRLWVGSTFGLFADGKQVEYSQKLIVTSMERDSRGNILFASKDSCFLIRDGRIQHLDIPTLRGHEVRSLHLSPRGFLILAVIDGLFVGRISKDYAVSDLRFYDHTNGFTALEPLMATMAEGSDGTVWLAGVEEVTSFNPAVLLAYDEHDTYIAPPLRWWQRWWVWLIIIATMLITVWLITRWYEKRRNRQRMIRLEREKLQREQQIEDIRQKAIRATTDEANVQTGSGTLAKDIVKMTEHAAYERLTFRTASGTIVADTKDIAYFKADGNYSQLVTFHGQDTILVGLGALEKTLNPEVFVRADRSTLVNIHHISELMPRQRRCIFCSPAGEKVETTLLAPAFKRLQALL